MMSISRVAWRKARVGQGGLFPGERAEPVRGQGTVASAFCLKDAAFFQFQVDPESDTEEDAADEVGA